MTDSDSDYPIKVRAVLLSALMVLSVVVGTIAFSGAAAAQTFDSGSVTPSEVDAQTTNDHDVTVTISDVDTSGDSPQALSLDFPDALDLSETTAEGFSATNMTNPTVSINQSTNVVTIQTDDDGGVTNDTVEYTFTATNVTTPDVDEDVTGGVTAAFDATNDGTDEFSDEPVETLTIQAQADGDANRLGPGGEGPFDTADGAGVILEGAIVFQGEDDIEFGGNLSSSLTGVSGDAEGQVLSPPIPTDQQVGIYSNDGQPDSPSVTVDRPRITTFDVNNQNNEDISGGSVSRNNADELTVVANYNYNEAEDLELTVEDEDGLDITSDVADQTTANAAGDVEFPIDLSDESAGTYTITVAGVDNLDFGAASQSTTVEVTADDQIGIEVANDTVTQGDNVRYEVTAGVAGDLHLVQIDASDFRDDRSAEDYARIFRNVGDVEERGIRVDDNLHEAGEEVPDDLDTDVIDGAYAIVTIDDDTGLGVGSIETAFLDTVSVTVDVSDPIPGDSDVATNLGDSSGDPEPVPEFAAGDQESADDVDFTVEEGDVTLDSPGQTYVVGAEVDVNGSAPVGLDNVAIYARDEGDFELVEVGGERDIAVDADGTFEETDVRLNEGDGGGNDILALPGSYRIGVIDATDADFDDTEGPDDTLTTQEFNQGTSNQRSIRVIDTSLDAGFPSLIDGQIAEEDGDVDVNGTAPGSTEVLFIAVGPRGQVETQSITVDSDQTFDEEDVPVGLSRGAISLHVYSVGRDGRAGDGDVPGQDGSDISAFADFVEGLNEDSLTGDQVRSSILSESVDDTASDDSIVNQNARLVDAQSSITNVYQSGNQAEGINPVAAGETMVVEGQTNLQPDDNTITLELSSEDTSVALGSTDQWNRNGEFSIELDTEDAATGTYTLELDDGENTVTEEVELVETLETPTPTPTEETETETPTETESPTATPTATPGDGTPAASPGTETPTEGGGPGFGAVVALVALLAAALLAVRRSS
jgi:major cell surface glycoprotein (TIGR04216 family)